MGRSYRCKPFRAHSHGVSKGLSRLTVQQVLRNIGVGAEVNSPPSGPRQRYSGFVTSIFVSLSTTSNPLLVASPFRQADADAAIRAVSVQQEHSQN